MEVFDSSLKKCLSFADLVRVASLTTIGVPIFIAHGGKYDTKDAFEKLDTIPQKSLFALSSAAEIPLTAFFRISIKVSPGIPYTPRFFL